MVITKDQLARSLAEKTEYYLKDVKNLLSAMDEVVKEYFAEVTDDEEVMIQVTQGIKVGCSVQPERARRNPQTQEDIICAPTVKPKARFSSEFRNLIQKKTEGREGELLWLDSFSFLPCVSSCLVVDKTPPSLFDRFLCA